MLYIYITLTGNTYAHKDQNFSVANAIFALGDAYHGKL